MRVSRVTRSKQEARSTYDRLSGWYDLLAGRFERRHREAGVRRLAARPGEALLEIGYGTGHAVVALAEAAGPAGCVYGIDISDRMRAIAQARVEQAGLSERVTLECGDAVRLPFTGGRFDAIFICFTLELFDTPEIPAVLAECLRTLCPGGRISVVALSREGRPTVMTRLYDWMHAALPRYADCRPIYVPEALAQAGFRIDDVARASMAGLRVALVLAHKPG